MQATYQPHVETEPRSDAELIERVRRGELQAYGTLVERYERTVLAAVLGVLRDAHAAQDVVQDVFVGCFTRLGSLRDPSRFGPWLLKSAEREAVHASRRARQMRITATPDAVDVGVEPRESLLSDERDRLLQCVRSLPAHERLAVSLRYFEGRGVHDIAKATGLAVGTVTKQLSRAIERLRDQLKRESESWQSTKNEKSLAR
jgi:RNA polymerase sigma-70 factor (ECF subfamily)